MNFMCLVKKNLELLKKGVIMIVNIIDLLTGVEYTVNILHICYFHKRVNEFGKIAYIITLSNNKEIVVTHKQWNKIKNKVIGLTFGPNTELNG